MGVPDRLFRALTRLLPAEFRGEYEREMSATFRADRQAATNAAGLARVWLATIADVFRTAPGEHFDILRRDLAYTARILMRRPALTMTAILTLALGIGANTAIFSVVNGVLFAPLPYAAADRLVMVEERRGDRDPGTTGYLSYEALRDENSSFESLAAFSGWSAVFTGDGKDAERAVGARVTWNYFRTLGLRPAIGRDFDASEDTPQRRQLAIISDAFWRRRYSADPGIVGRPVTINQVTYTLAGVMPASVSDLVTTRKFPDAEVWTLLGYAGTLPQACRSCRHINVVGRVRQGTSIQQAEADVTRIYQSLASRHATEYDRPSAAVSSVGTHFLGPVERPLYLLWGAVALLLVIACANIANLLLIRASEREEEIAVRRALGVSPSRMLRQLLTEAVVLALIGGGAGVALAWWATAIIVRNGPPDIPRLDEVAVDGRVLIYALGISVATGLIFGMAPARALIARRDGGNLTSRRTTSGPAVWRHRAALIGVNVALSALLLVGSGLLVRSFLRVLRVDTGFNAAQLLTFEVDLTGRRYAEIPAITQFYDAVTARLASLPGVTHVSGATQLPLTGSVDRSGITIDGRVLDNPAAAPNADRYAVRPAYFAAMAIPLRRGRVFTEGDGQGAPPVAIVSETMAQQLWPGEDPLGRRIRVAGGEGNPMRTIVGVVGDVRHYGLAMPATLQVYIPHAQTYYPESILTLVVRVADDGDPLSLAASVREQVRAVDAMQPLNKLRTYDAIVAQSLAARRFTLALLAGFAVTALVLAVVGLYGALSYVVTQRQREIGVRVALGAGAAHIRSLVMRQGMMPTLLGLLVGLLASVALSRIVESMLYDTSARDALTYAAVSVVIGGCAVTACLLPARRAAGVDPAVTLRD